MRITVYVKPLKRQTQLLKEPDGTLTMHVAAPPAKGKANREIVKWISKRLGKPTSEVRIVAGVHSNVKTIEIYDANEVEVASILGIKMQQART